MATFERITSRLDAIQKYTSLTTDDIDYLTQPENIESFTVSYEDEGTVKEADAYRIRFNEDRGPGKGGIRYHPGVEKDEVLSLSFWMALKTSLANIPFGGAKGGVAINTKALDRQQLDSISRSYVQEISDELGPNKDIPAPDMYTDERIMAIMLDEYETITGEHAPAMITGKPVGLGGSPGRDTATADGAYDIFKEVTQGQQDIAIQGFGNAGKQFAELVKDDHNVVAVSDSSGAIYDADGLSIDDVTEAKAKTGVVTEAQGTQITNEELLALDVDTLVPAALGDVITQDNVEDIQANTILEIANGPISPTADDILANQEITVIPDILANSGGVIVSYYEWVQNRSGDQWKQHDVRQRLRQKMHESYEDVTTHQDTHNTTLRESAYAVAAEHLINAARYRGKQ